MSAVVSASMAPSPPRRRGSRAGVLPGFGLSMGFTLLYLSLLVLILAAVFIPWMRLAHRGIQKSGLHFAGATPNDFLPEAGGRVGAVNLFESPTAAIRGLLAAKPAKAKEQH